MAKICAKCILAVSNIKVTGSCIYMPNHVSNFDIPVLQAYLPVQFKWLAKAELFKIPIFGYAMKRAGYISINRFDRKAAIQSLNKASEIIRNGTSVIIFPEGTRSQNKHVQSFKKGGFILAVDSGVPIIPVIIHGTWTIMQKKHILVRPGNVVLEIKKPINTSDYTRETKDDLMEKVRNIVLDSYDKNRKNETLC
ncbi:MAG: 1-acyl-sn-glycerol-3-phosphate acyltransferase [Deltaproteobacteria bacterium]|nr:1-acyl-sn-glycerol-3-phosphate acyltransferase [Deltaproteobacteria bacterium]